MLRRGFKCELYFHLVLWYVVIVGLFQDVNRESLAVFARVNALAKSLGQHQGHAAPLL